MIRVRTIADCVAIAGWGGVNPGWRAVRSTPLRLEGDTSQPRLCPLAHSLAPLCPVSVTDADTAADLNHSFPAY